MLAGGGHSSHYIPTCRPQLFASFTSVAAQDSPQVMPTNRAHDSGIPRIDELREGFHEPNGFSWGYFRNLAKLATTFGFEDDYVPGGRDWKPDDETARSPTEADGVFPCRSP